MISKFCTICLFFLLAQYRPIYAQCYELVWSDEFDGTGLPNSAYWGYDLGTGGGWGNNEVQNYTNSTNNVRQEDGVLIIEAKKSGSNWTSARVKSQGKINFTYGRIVFRAKLPTGAGTWPALWMLGESITTAGWPACGEIDVMEHVGKNPTVVQAAMHTPSSFGNTVNKGSRNVPTFDTEFHNYEVLWTAEKIQFFIDGVLYYTYNPATKNANTWPFTAPQFIIMNIAMGGNFGGDPQYPGGIDPAITYAKMEVDYVRYYEPRTSPAITGPSFVTEQQENLTFEATEYPEAVYNWAVPEDAQILSGQGTKSISVDWGNSDGEVVLEIDGETGCTNNITVWPVKTIIQPTGLNYLVDDFGNTNPDGWSDNVDNAVIFTEANNQLSVSYNTTSIRYLQYQAVKPLNLTDYGIIKFRMKVPTASPTLPKLILTLIDGDGNETGTTQYELNASKQDDQFYTYSYEFEGLWGSNSPSVNPASIRTIRFYMLSGEAQFVLDDLYFFNSKSAPQAPEQLSVVQEESSTLLNWVDNSNGTKYHIYRSDSENGDYARFRSNILSKDIPAILNIAESINYFKVSALNSQGESALSEAIEIESTVSGINPILDSQWAIFPNPSTGYFNVSINNSSDFYLKIYNTIGVEQPFSVVPQASGYRVDLGNVSHGIYYVIYHQAQGRSVKKLVIE